MLQPSFNGKVGVGENLLQALKREAREELGGKFADSFNFLSLNKFFTGEFVFKSEKFIAHNYAGRISGKQLRMIKLHSAASKILLLSKNDILKIKTIKDGGDPSKELVMFDDQLVALRKIVY